MVQRLTHGILLISERFGTGSQAWASPADIAETQSNTEDASESQNRHRHQHSDLLILAQPSRTVVRRIERNVIRHVEFQAAKKVRPLYKRSELKSRHLLNYEADHSINTMRAQTRRIRTLLLATRSSNSETTVFPQNGALPRGRGIHANL